MARSTTSETPVGHTRLFSALMWSIPVLFFALLELGLRVVGYGETLPLFVPITGYESYLQPSDVVARRFFPSSGVVPGIPFDSFGAQKDSSTTRIFVQGGSTAAGFPFYFGGSFADMLEQRLLQTAPDRPVEVINTAMAAVNSYTLLDFVDEIIEQDPDIVLIYAGHNEYYGALGVGSSVSFGRSPALVRMFLALDNFRTVQALRTLLGKIASVGKREVDENAASTLMEQVVGEQSIPLDSRLYRAGLDQFQSNLRRILARYAKAGVPVYIGTLASNLRDHRPFISGLSTGTDANAYREALKRINDAERGGEEASSVLDRVDELIAVDSLAADPWFIRGRLLLRLGRDKEALTAFVAARDRDQLRFRAPTAMNEIIRTEAARTDAVVVETERRLADHSTDGIIGSDLMTEHLHPNISGYFQLSAAFYDSLLKTNAVPGVTRVVSDESARSELLVTAIDSLVGQFRVQQLTGSWPFQPKGTLSRFQLPEESTDRVQQIAVDLYRRKVPRNVALDELRAYYLSKRDYHNALRATLAVVQRYPFLASPYLSAASIMVEQRRLDEALAYVDASLDRAVTAEALGLKGSVLLARNEAAAAIPILEQARQLDPSSVPTEYNLAGAYAMMGRRSDALQAIESVLRKEPQNQAASALRSSLLR